MFSRSSVISAVIPFRVMPGNTRPLRRLRRVLRQMPEGVTPLVVDDTADAGLRKRVAATVAGVARARHVRHPESAHCTFSIGRLRDVGTAAAPDRFVLFHDVDFTAPPEMYRALAAFVQQPAVLDDPSNSLCIPVFFLTRKGTRRYRAFPRWTWRRLLRGQGRGGVDRLVRGSSAILAHRETLLAEGGHDPAFTGHGAEDFELLHRLAKRHPRGARPANYHVDHGSRSQRGDGFRAYFARYGQPPLDAGLALVHLWHPKRTDDPRYYNQQRANFALLSARLQEAGDRA